MPIDDPKDRPLAEVLRDEAYRFDFYQAVKLLEAMLPEATSVAEGVDPQKEAVHFHSRVGLEFPATAVDSIEPPEGPGGPADMIVNFFGLAGIQGPLPDWVTELVIDRGRYRDSALRDFLDLFNHRLISMLYRARKKYRPALDHTPPPPHPCCPQRFRAPRARAATTA